jgi:hypothetical protein
MRDFRLTVDDSRFDKMNSAILTFYASDCQHVPLDGIKTRYSFVERVLCQNSRKNQIIPLDGIKTLHSHLHGEHSPARTNQIIPLDGIKTSTPPESHTSAASLTVRIR